MSQHPTQTLDRAQRLRIVGEALVDERTVQRAYRGQPVQSTSRLRIVEAAQRLGYPPPPAAATAGAA